MTPMWQIMGNPDNIVKLGVTSCSDPKEIQKLVMDANEIQERVISLRKQADRLKTEYESRRDILADEIRKAQGACKHQIVVNHYGQEYSDSYSQCQICDAELM